jgi:hypothetical protein
MGWTMSTSAPGLDELPCRGATCGSPGIMESELAGTFKERR